MTDFPKYNQTFKYKGGFNKWVFDKIKELDPYADTYAISGKVTVGSTALAGVVVTAASGKTSTTDDKGKFNIRGLDAGTYNLTATKSGYQADAVSVTITTKNVTQNITMEVAKHTVTCNVSNGSSAIASANIKLKDKNSTTEFTGTSGETGACVLANVPDGTYTLTATATGYADYTHASDIVVDGNETVSITMTQA